MAGETARGAVIGDQPPGGTAARVAAPNVL
jgi:hypothetical protein